MATVEAFQHGRHTITAVLVALPGTLVVILAEGLGAWLVASVLFMLWVCWMTYHFTHVTTLKPRVTRHCAPSLGSLFEIIRTSRVNHVLRVILTAKPQCLPHIPSLLHIVDYPGPQFAFFS